MKRTLAFALALILVLALLPASALADNEDTLTVQTRTASYTFRPGDTFTYSYWLRLTPDLVNYSEDYVSDYLKQSIASSSDLSLALAGLQLSSLTKMTLKSVMGNILYDTDCLTLVKAEMPNLSYGRCVQKTDALSGTLLDGTVLDFTNGQLGFYSNIVQDNEKATFQNTNVLVTCTFRVTQGCDTPVYLRTRLRHLEVTTPGFLGLTPERDIIIVHRDQSVFIPYESYETIDDEQPTVVLKSLVDDVGLDIRYFNLSGDKEQFKRPGAGVTVTMMGATTDGRYVKLQQQTTGSDVLWFYDVPYGQYYVNCSLTDENGKFFATPDPEKAEHINVPATGEVQALWLIETDPEQTKAIHVYVDWVGDEGYLPARPDYLYAKLYSGQDINTVHDERLIDRTEDMVSFDCVNIYNDDGEKLDYQLLVGAVNDGISVGTGNAIVPYSISVEKVVRDDGGEDFYITATYQGDPSELGKIPEENGHYWIKNDNMTKLPTCETDGREYYLCMLCHQTKYVVLPASHTVVTDPGFAPTCTSPGKTEGSHCSACGKVLTGQNTIPAAGHRYTDTVTDPTCTEQGYTTHTCTVCGLRYADAYVPAPGHTWDDGVVTTAPTATADGVRTYTCTVCGASKTESIPATGVVTPPVHVCPGAIFTDMPKYGSWSHAGIDYCVNNGLMDGVGDGKFDPNGTTTRAMVVTILWRQAGCPEPTKASPFTDLKQDWYKKAVAWAAETGVVNGMTPTTFAPEKPISRQDMATILCRYVKDVLGQDVSKTADLSSFPDGGKVAGYAQTAMAWANAAGLIRGVGVDGVDYLDPQGNTTRAQAATILMRFCENVAS